jgi:hypothetical protein
MMQWADNWGIRFNVSKCKVMHKGRNNSKSDYVLGCATLEKTREEKDLGVIVMDTLKKSAAVQSVPRRPGRPTLS